MNPEKQAYLKQVELLRQQSVASVHPTPNPITDQDRAIHLAKVSETLERIANKGQLGGSVRTPSERQVDKRDQTSEQVKNLETKWRSGSDFAREVTILEGIDLGCRPARPKFKEVKSLDGSVSQVPILYCSYCEQEVEESLSTEGRAKPIIRKVDEVALRGGEMTIVTKTVVSSAKLIACPDCCLNLIPYEGKNGELIKPTKFKETEG